MDESMTLPVENERPSEFADRLGRMYAGASAQREKKDKGQFFTPLPIAEFMASLISVSGKDSVRILDPGCGSGVLSCALVESMVERNGGGLAVIALDLYDTDTALIPYTEKVLGYLGEWSAGRGVRLSYRLCPSDFVLENAVCATGASSLFSDGRCGKEYDCIIANPPYFKLAKNDERTVACMPFVDGQTNIYALFMAICAGMLADSGQMVFITPRSFASGRYFKSFRKFLFETVRLDFVHLFKTRKDTFAKDDVLQELVISSFRRGGGCGRITVSNSEGAADLRRASRRDYDECEIVDVESDEKVVYLPADDRDESVLGLFRTWTGNLGEYGIRISTGPVVAFRAYDEIVSVEEEGAVPLYWMHNVVKMLADHPVCKKDKGQYIRVNEVTRPYLLPNKNYVFLRRFSAKDDSSRLIAAPYFGNMSRYELVGVENKLNYIYRPGGRLRRDEVMGISALLNSSIFDTYFRTFNGNINVSATELRMMPMPPIEEIRKIGRKIILKNDYSLDYINDVLMDCFNIR